MEDYARYVRLQTNGVYVLCSENEADGVIANDEIHALDSVQLVEFIGTVELTDVRTELEQMIADARQNLISPPARDAPWSADVRYAAGDTVEGGYVALRYNRNKNPADYLGVYWVHDENEVVAWESIEDGTIIYAGGIVSCTAAKRGAVSSSILRAAYTSQRPVVPNGRKSCKLAVK